MIRSPARIAAVLGLAFAAACVLPWRAATAAPPSHAEMVALGARLYRDGITTEGRPLTAVTRTGEPVLGTQTYCVTCHRPSGFGSSEGGVYTPPITGPILFAPTKLHRYDYRFADMYKQIQPPGYNNRIHAPLIRPAFTTASLGVLLRTGRNPAGAIMREMPRYTLSDRDVAALSAYLKTLSAKLSPGVGARDMQFATIFTADVPPARRRAVVDTLRAYFRWTNRNTDDDIGRPGFSPFYRSGFVPTYRDWVLHVWILHGPARTWRAQLDADLAAQPVFAEVSGIVDGPWAPVGRFCDDHRLPCIFPQTELPSQQDGIDTYSIQFSDGLFLEARVMARFIAEQHPKARVIHEIVAPGPYGSEPAATFAAAVARALPGAKLAVTQVADGGGWARALRAASGGADVLVVWPGAHPAAAIAALRQQDPATPLILLPESATRAAKAALSGKLAARVRLTRPTVLPTAVNPESFRTRNWLAARGVGVAAPRAEFEAYYAARLLRAAVNRLVDDYYRDYLVEWVEEEAENSLDPGVYPHLALAPGQRHASSGAYVVRLDPAAQGGIRAVTPWIVP
ncbi:MAG: hypothetical protein KGL52_16165 [Rhodospirillales bacterium]|nr:hypothetical protein [Rhodospirillales bacterium]